MSQHETTRKIDQAKPKGSVRQERIQILKRRILSGRYDADGKIDSLVEQLVKDAL